MSEEERALPLRRRLMFSVGLLLAVIVSVELLSAAGAFLLTQLGWPEPGQAAAAGEAEALAAPSEQQALDGWTPWNLPVLHPYLGFTWDPGDPSNNAFGFPGRDDTLRDRGPETVLIAVTGGSVAQQMWSGYRERLADGLRASPAFANKDLRLVCWALPAYKQPQQLIALSYFLSLGIQPDIVINLDGFNEVANGLNNEAYRERLMHPAFPAPEPWLHLAAATPSMADLTAAGEVHLLRSWRRELQRKAAALRFSFTVRLLRRVIDRAIERRIVTAEQQVYARMLDRKRPLTATQVGPRALFKEGAMYAELTALWERSSLQMHALARANGGQYFHFLQPNQYVPGSKVLSEWEREHVVDRSGRFPTSVIEGYPYLFEGGERLAERGVAFHDLTRIFINETAEGTYIDPCCHLNSEGNAILVDRIAEVIVAAQGAPSPE